MEEIPFKRKARGWWERCLETKIIDMKCQLSIIKCISVRSTLHLGWPQIEYNFVILLANANNVSNRIIDWINGINQLNHMERYDCLTRVTGRISCRLWNRGKQNKTIPGNARNRYYIDLAPWSLGDTKSKLNRAQFTRG